jgi:5-methylcytosine-specific restriction endonuclease McrA
MTPCDYSKYPADWKRIRERIITRAGDACEWCGAENHTGHPETGSLVVLTIAHVDHDIGHNDPVNLRALCQRCHNEHDAPHRSHGRRYGRDPDQGKLPI